MQCSRQLIVIALLASGLALTMALPQPGIAVGQRDEPALVRIHGVAPAAAYQVQQSGVELLAARDGDDLFALTTSAGRHRLRAAGWQLTPVPAGTGSTERAMLQASFAGYSSVEATYAFLHSTATSYPGLATLVDFGDSWQRIQTAGSAGYDLLALRLTNQAVAGPKPMLLVIGAIHAREWTTVEIANRLISYLLQGYGDDATVTWLLDEHEIVVVPIANPDGRKLAEQGYLQRKNMNTTRGSMCSMPPAIHSQPGVDLNRNFAYAWGTVDRPTLDPCLPTYPGTAPASEPETAALQQFITTLYPDRPRPANGAPAPDDTSGVLISLHSFGNMVLWPWGHTALPAPNSAGLSRLGQQMAQLAGYRPDQSYQLYPTSGTTDDWAYAELGLAAYTFEIGPVGGRCGFFTPPYSCLDGESDGNFWGRTLPPLLYAAGVSRAPYRLPNGPHIQSLDIVQGGNGLRLRATVGGQDYPVAAVEYYLAAAPWRGGTPVAIDPADGTFDTLTEFVYADLPAPDAHTGSAQQLILLRARNSTGVWGPFRAAWLRAESAVWLPLVVTSTHNN